MTRIRSNDWAISMRLVGRCCLGVCLLAGCASQSRQRPVPVESQSYAQAIRQICGVDALAGITVDTDELERSRRREDHIVLYTKNSDAIFFVTIWRTKPPSEQSTLLAEQARQAQLPSCKLAADLRAQ
jgi:hypothetical protein